MVRDQVMLLLSEHREELDRLGVKSLAIFGSTARGEAGEGSDVDILMEFNGPASFDSYFSLKEFLEELLARPIDLVTRRALKPRLRTRVEEEAIYVTR